MEVDAYIALGSNIGNRLGYIQKAIKAICKLENTCVVKVSEIYETNPVGYVEQDKFLNMVIMIKTCFTPFELLEKLQEIEHMLKRKRVIHWGPRTIDLDILIFDGITLHDPKLTIPHPEMLKRAFVLIPLKDIAPDIKFYGNTIDFYIKTCDDKDTINIFK